MITQRLTDFSQVEALYRIRLKEDFPPDELKPLDSMRRSWGKDAYECYGLFDGDDVLGYAFFVRRERDFLLDYFAIAREHRDRGLGTLFLRQLADRIRGANCAVCEVQDPDKAVNEKERIERERRLRFYLRSGFRKTELTSVLFGVNYRILEMPGTQAHTLQQVREAYTELYRRTLPEELFLAEFQVKQ
ncbi:MAG: GNAT family N-acetyltransferase [Clostridia bacterium]|nr:GNAT family N-acetyltransferase [Clostridia bacterium]